MFTRPLREAKRASHRNSKADGWSNIKGIVGTPWKSKRTPRQARCL